MRMGLVLILGLLMACAPENHTRVNTHVDVSSGRVTPAVATSVGGVRVGASPYGAAIGTYIGPVGVSAGF